MLSTNEISKSVIPPDTVINDADVTGADVLDVPVATTPKPESGAPIPREEVDELLYDNPEPTVAEIEKVIGNLSSGTKGGFDSEARETIQTAKRVVVRIGSSLLAGSDGHIDPERIDLVVGTLGKRMGISNAIVMSSDAVVPGMEPLGLTSHPSDLVTK